RDPAPGEWARGVQSVLRKTGLYMVDAGAARGVLEKRLRAQGFEAAFVDTIEHDRAHTTVAYRTQPREELLLCTLDSPGDGACLSVSVAKHLQIDTVHVQTALASAATFPARIAKILNVPETELEWVAAGEPGEALLNRLRSELHYEGPGFNRLPLRRGPDPLTAFAAEGPLLAEAALRVMSEAFRACVADHIRRTGIAHVGVAGSLWSPRLLSELAEIPGLESLWVPPMPGDAGLSVGAVLATAGTVTQRLRDPCLGPRYAEDACYRALSNASLPREAVADPDEEAAILLSEGKTVARFAGPLEFSARGLGNRDFLCSTAQSGARLSELLRLSGPAPVGVALRAEFAEAAFPGIGKVANSARFQTVALRPSAAFAAAHPGALRGDGRMLPQVVHEQDDPSFYRLLAAYERRSGRQALTQVNLARPDLPVAASP
ncbi:MAG TPA: carbamoyltransferase C-terminal domain-containing protein, partial [Myxococcota bacterium]|nr:carbamoyltransferase C-terminal domain-containing protein [Myxococcota bacterium]